MRAALAVGVPVSGHRKVVDDANLPTRLPFLTTAVAWLLMDRFGASDTVQGVVWTVLAILWIASVISVFQQEPVRIWPKDGAR